MKFFNKNNALSKESNEQLNRRNVFLDYSHRLLNFVRKPQISSFIFYLIIFSMILLILLGNENDHLSRIAYDQNKQEKAIMNALDDVSRNVQRLTAYSQKSAEFKETLITINQNLTDIKTSVASLAKTSDVLKVDSDVIAMQQNMNEDMDDLKKMVVSQSKDYLDPKVLPFHVISIDMLAEQPFISIDYNHHITPLTLGDSLAGWMIMQANYEKSYVEFKNANNKYVKVVLEG